MREKQDVFCPKEPSQKERKEPLQKDVYRSSPRYVWQKEPSFCEVFRQRETGLFHRKKYIGQAFVMSEKKSAFSVKSFIREKQGSFTERGIYMSSLVKPSLCLTKRTLFLWSFSSERNRALSVGCGSVNISWLCYVSQKWDTTSKVCDNRTHLCRSRL